MSEEVKEKKEFKQRVYDDEASAKAAITDPKERVFVVKLGDAVKYVADHTHPMAMARGARALGVTCAVSGSPARQVNLQESVLNMPAEEREKLRALLDEMEGDSGGKKKRRQ